MNDGRSTDEIMDDIDARLAAFRQRKWVEQQRRMLDQRRRIRAGQDRAPVERPLAKVVPLVRRTA